MGHADSIPSVYGSFILWLNSFAKQELLISYRAFIGGKLLSHSIELPHTEGTESACPIGLMDTTGRVKIYSVV